jgi:hypothetical protein
VSSELVSLYQQREHLLMTLAEVSARQLQIDDEKTVLAANARQLVSALQENTRRLSAVRSSADASAQDELSPASA